jgi:hypothetical protein
MIPVQIDETQQVTVNLAAKTKSGAARTLTAPPKLTISNPAVVMVTEGAESLTIVGKAPGTSTVEVTVGNNRATPAAAGPACAPSPPSPSPR